MNYPNMSNVSGTKAILEKAWSYFSSNFLTFTRFTLLIYLPLLTITSLQIIIYFFKSYKIISSIIFDLLGVILSLLTTLISLATEPTIYALLVLVALQIFNEDSIQLQVVKDKFKKRSSNFIKAAVVFFVYFITVQQMTQALLLLFISFNDIKTYIDLETFFFSDNIPEKMGSIQLDKIILSIYPFKYFVTEFISIIVAAFAVRKYFLYVPIVFIEDVNDLIPLKNSKMLVGEVKAIATKVVLLAVIIPYGVNTMTCILLTNILGIKGTANMMISNIAAAKEISLFTSGLINIFIYPTIVIAVLLLYLKAKQSLETKPKN